MKVKHFVNVVIFATMGASLTAQAHDPKEHMKDAEKPDCAAMKDMDHSKMDMNDPVMQAMMKQCMKGMHEPETDEAHADHEDKVEAPDTQHSQHPD